MSSKSEDAWINQTKVKWSADNITGFLETYINYELLWNFRHCDYKNKSKRERAMIRLRNELISLGIVVPDLRFLRARIKSIKTTYASEFLKMTESEANGAESEYVYRPKLPWFPAADAFMRDLVITRRGISNLATPATSTHDDGMDEELDETEHLTEPVEHVDTLLEEDTSSPTSVISDLQTPTSKKRRVSQLSKAESTIEKVPKLPKDHRSTSILVQDDEVEIFGKYVATQLRDLPVVHRLTLQDKIQSMLIRERLKLLT